MADVPDLFREIRVRKLMLLLMALFAMPALAQHYAPPHPELASDDQPARNVPTRSYTLSLSWAPEYCHGARGARADDPECRGQAGEGFTLHGLWPDGDGPNRWPQYCHPVAILTDAEIAAGVAATPSPQLLQHEWAKHGSCTGTDPIAYFREEGRLYRGIRTPDMAALARRAGLTAGDVQRAFAAANPGMTPQMLRINANKQGWMQEAWICLGLNKRPRVCPADAGGVPEGSTLRIQPPRRTGYRRVS